MQSATSFLHHIEALVWAPMRQDGNLLGRVRVSVSVPERLAGFQTQASPQVM